MNEEIKEILDNLELVSKKQYGVEELFDDDMIGILYNYITNLQQENESLKKQINDIKRLDRMRFNMVISHYGILKESGNNE